MPQDPHHQHDQDGDHFEHVAMLRIIERLDELLVQKILNNFQAMEKRIMQNLDALNAAVDALATADGQMADAVTLLGTNITDELAAVAKALADANTGNDPAIQAVADRVTTLATNVGEQTQKIADAAKQLADETASLNPPAG